MFIWLRWSSSSPSLSVTGVGYIFTFCHKPCSDLQTRVKILFCCMWEVKPSSVSTAQGACGSVMLMHFTLVSPEVFFFYHAQKRAEMPPLGQREPRAQPRLEGRDLPGLRALQKKTWGKMVPQGHAGKPKCWSREAVTSPSISLWRTEVLSSFPWA